LPELFEEPANLVGDISDDSTSRAADDVIDLTGNGFGQSGLYEIQHGGCGRARLIFGYAGFGSDLFNEFFHVFSLLVLECGDLSPLWSVATCRDHRRLKITERAGRQAAQD
jgi:hypothetical protein